MSGGLPASGVCPVGTVDLLNHGGYCAGAGGLVAHRPLRQVCELLGCGQWRGSRLDQVRAPEEQCGRSGL